MMRTSDEYVMGRTSEEYQRLRSQAQLWNPATRRLFQEAGLHAGMSCLDVGCGPGEVMRILGEIAGPAGRVTGLDVDGKIGREALDALQATSDGRFAFVEGNAESDEPFPEAAFDVTFARITLVHVKDPAAVLRKMYAWTKRDEAHRPVATADRRLEAQALSMNEQAAFRREQVSAPALRMPSSRSFPIVGLSSPSDGRLRPGNERTGGQSHDDSRYVPKGSCARSHPPDRIAAVGVRQEGAEDLGRRRSVPEGGLAAARPRRDLGFPVTLLRPWRP